MGCRLRALLQAERQPHVAKLKIARRPVVRGEVLALPLAAGAEGAEVAQAPLTTHLVTALVTVPAMPRDPTRKFATCTAATRAGYSAACSLGWLHCFEGGRCPHARPLVVLARPLGPTRCAAEHAQVRRAGAPRVGEGRRSRSSRWDRARRRSCTKGRLRIHLRGAERPQRRNDDVRARKASFVSTCLASASHVGPAATSGWC
jgi:hypothetical protein